MNYRSIRDFILRHGIIAALFVSTLALTGFSSAANTQTILYVCTIESVALFLSGIAAYVYTAVDFRRSEDNHVALAIIFLGVHCLVGASIVGTYFTRF